LLRGFSDCDNGSQATFVVLTLSFVLVFTNASDLPIMAGRCQKATVGCRPQFTGTLPFSVYNLLWLSPALGCDMPTVMLTKSNISPVSVKKTGLDTDLKL
jgi:hypothetical protein